MASDEHDGATTSQWLSFFKEAGIPAGIAVSYALTFSDNRIKMDMLLDLNKEYLRDMGITMMGDVIAILKHAKNVHEKAVRERILGTSSATGPTPKRSTPATRMLEHYMRKEDESPVRAKLSDSLAQRLGPISEKKKESKREAEAVEEVPVKKARRVLPEHEGKYKVTMPKGNTARTRKILSKQGAVPKKTVFDRLGDGVSSTTADVDKPRITITGLGTNIIKTDKSSVFSRLGDKAAGASSSSMEDDEMEGVDEFENIEEDTRHEEEPLQYAGIFKHSAPTKRKVLPSKTASGTLRADTVPGKKISKLQGRLGTKGLVDSDRKITRIIETTGPDGKIRKIIKVAKQKNATEGILANPTNAVKVSVKERLGNSPRTSLQSTSPAKAKMMKRIGFNKLVVKRHSDEGTSGIMMQHERISPKKISSKVEMPFSSSSSVCSESGSITMRCGMFGRIGRNSS